MGVASAPIVGRLASLGHSERALTAFAYEAARLSWYFRPMTTALSAAFAGLQRGFGSFERAAADVVSSTSTGEGDPVRAVADLLGARVQTVASARVAKAADESLGKVLDILA